jgi:hypothetical protein
MLEAVLAIVILGGFFVLRGIAATIVFFYLLPAGDRCPNCDGATIRVESKGWNRTLPWFRTSWCLDCGWHGLLRHGPLTPTDASADRLVKKD